MVLHKLLGFLVTGLTVTVATFTLIHLAPGDPLDAYLGQEGASAAEKALIRKTLGLDDPLPTRFVKYAGRLAGGDLGSIPGKGPVSRILARRFAATARLTVLAIVLAVAAGVSIGLAAGWYANTVFDRTTQVASIFLISTPIFWTGLVALLVFSWAFNLLPATGCEGIESLIMPAVVLALRPAALLLRVTRVNAMEAKRQTFVLAARARGLSGRAVLVKHVLKYVSIPVVTIVGMDLASLLSGAVITETVFSYQGLGQFAVEAISNRWYDAVMAVALLWAGIFVVANFLVDLSYAALDPRIRGAGA